MNKISQIKNLPLGSFLFGFRPKVQDSSVPIASTYPLEPARRRVELAPV